MLTALTRKPGPRLAECALQFLERAPIDLAKAKQQHDFYESCLGRLGARVVSLPALPSLPDSVFIEDPAVVVAEAAVLAPMGNPSRREESVSLARTLEEFRPLLRVEAPGTLEGGDILQIGRTLYAGLSGRTNRDGVRQLAALLNPYGYRVIPVEVRRCLHLKTACTYVGGGTLLANRHWFDASPFGDFEILDTPPAEPWAANTLRIGDTVLLPASFPRTAARLERRGFQVATLDISEFQKAEGGLTCLSVRFEA
jgi:dimethylargininase